MIDTHKAELAGLPAVEELFEEQARHSPGAIAVVCGEQRIAYEELNKRANQLAHYLIKLGVKAESRVGVYMERDIDMIVAVLAILKSAGAYVPLDPKYPQDRTAYIISDSGIKLLLTQKRVVPTLPLLNNVQLLCLDEWDRIAQEPCDYPEVRVTEDNLAYVIYTSGSTGRPKGVGISRKNTAAFAQWARGVFGDDLKGVLASTSICFDLSVFEIFVPLTFGGTVFLVDNALDLPAIRTDQDLRLLNTVPSVLVELLQRGPLPETVRTVNLAGEALHRGLVNQVWKEENVERVFNLYGPTEGTTYSTCARLDQVTNGRVSIGTAIAGTQVYVLDEQYEPVAEGTSGELYIAGEGLARGYIHQPALTAERFVPNPFSRNAGERMYRTGDRVLRLPDGNLEFIGRLDTQIKLRGFRIELGEIETVLNQHPEIREAVVAVSESDSGMKRLVAYASPRKDPGPTALELRSYLSRQLPDYMLPVQFVFLQELPRTQTGKLSRRELPPAEFVKQDICFHTAPQTEMEQKLAVACAEVLGVSSVPLSASFLELGGSSLNATRVVAALRSSLWRDFPIRELLAGKPLREVAAEYEKHQSFSPASPETFARASARISPLPASYSQERVWFIQQLNPFNLAYTFTAQITFQGALDVAALEQALSCIVQRHEIFRTTLAESDGRLFQVVHAPWKVELDSADMRGQPGEARQFLRQLASRPFDLGRLPLVRWNLVRLDDQKYLFQSVEHHIIHDGWSYYVFLKELTQLYRSFTEGTAPQIHDSPLQFADFACWQREWIETPEAEEQMRYWSDTLAGAQPLLSLPYDHPRPEIETYKGACLRIDIGAELDAALSAAARRSCTTPFMLCAAALQILLFRYTDVDDFCIGTGIANRRWPETSDLIGMLVNNIALRLRTRRDSTLEEVIKGVRETAVAAYANQDLPFDKVVQVTQPQRDLSYNPIFQVMLNFHDSPVTCPELANLTMQIEQALNNGSAKFDLNILFVPAQSHNLPPSYRPSPQILWEYNTDLFEPGTMQRMSRHYLRLLEMVIKSPQMSVGEIPLLDETERRQILEQWNEPGRQYLEDGRRNVAAVGLQTAATTGVATQERPQFRSGVVHNAFAECANTVPDAAAVLFGDEEVTYRELDRRSNRMAQYLKRMRPALEQRIGVCLNRSLEAVVTFLAILKAGHAYVPLDPTFPPERLAFMVADAELSMILTQGQYLHSLPETTIPTYCLETLADSLAAEPDLPPKTEVVPENLAYVMYTSGSTGEPKGVAIPHKAIIRLLSNVDYVRLGRDETLLQLAPLGFDASTFELWAALLHGGRLVVYPKAELDLHTLKETIRKGKVSCLWLTASLFNLIVDSDIEILRSVRQVLTGGEALSLAHIDRALTLLPEVTIINGYGPTEGTTFSCCFKIPRPRPAEWTSIPIGNPISDTQIFILDACGLPAPPGVTGELYIGGDGLARAYLNSSDLTAERFLPNPFSRFSGERMYRTGDLVRWHPQSGVEFLGRNDDQVKIRGHRIELGEIEQTLLKHPAVKEAVIAMRQDSPGQKQVVAYIVTQPQSGTRTDDLETFLKSKLPPYMIPTTFVAIDKLPLTSAGKVDRRALPVPEDIQPHADFSRPLTETEELLVTIWQDVLHVENVGPASDFFKLGGHSLKVMQVISRIRDLLSVQLEVQHVFNNPVLTDMAHTIDQRKTGHQAVQPPLVAHHRDGELPLSFNEEILWTIAQAYSHYLAFNSQIGAWLQGSLDRAALQSSFDEIVARHEALRTTFAVSNRRPVRVIHKQGRSTIRQIDLSHVPENDRRNAVSELAKKEALTPFDLAHGPLMRVTVMNLDPQQHVLLITVHHIVTDGWSLGLLARELHDAYRAYAAGERPSLPAVRLQYADYAIWQRSWLQGDAFNALLAYWTARLSRVTDPRRLTPDVPATIPPLNRQGDLMFSLPGTLVDRLKTLSHKEGVTFFMALLAVFKLQLFFLTGASDIVVSVPISERSRSELEHVMGLFVNLVAIHTDFRGDPTFRDLLDQIRKTSQEAYVHQAMPFGIVQEALGRNPHLNCVMLDFINVPNFDIDLPGLKAERCSTRGVNPLGMDVILFARETGGRVDCTLAYNADMFSPAWANKMARQFVQLAERCAEAPERALSAHFAALAGVMSGDNPLHPISESMGA